MEHPVAVPSAAVVATTSTNRAAASSPSAAPSTVSPGSAGSNPRATAVQPATKNHRPACDDPCWQADDDSCGQLAGGAAHDGVRVPDWRAKQQLEGTDPRADDAQPAACKSHRMPGGSWPAADDSCRQVQRPLANSICPTSSPAGPQAPHDGSIAQPPPLGAADKCHRVKAAGDDPCRQLLSAGEQRGSYSSSPTERVSSWSVDDVCGFLATVNLKHHATSFRSEGVDGAMLLECMHEEGALQELGVAKALERARLKSNLSKELSALTIAFTSASVSDGTVVSKAEVQLEKPQEPAEVAAAVDVAKAAEVAATVVAISPVPEVAAGERKADEASKRPCLQDTDVMRTERDYDTMGYEPESRPATTRIGSKGSSTGFTTQGSPSSTPAPSPGGNQSKGSKRRGGRNRTRGARKLVQPNVADPAVQARFDAPAFSYTHDEEQMLAGVRSQRGTPKPGGDFRAPDSHLPNFWRLDSSVWEKAEALPSEAVLFAMDEYDSHEWNSFLGRVLPHSSANPHGLLAYGVTASIHNEDCDFAFDPTADPKGRAAALARLGWPQGLPTSRRLKQHMLKRVEHEYSEHLLEHGYTPGQWCDECKCICTHAVDAHVAAAAEPNPNPSYTLCDDADADDDDEIGGGDDVDDDMCSYTGSEDLADAY